MLEVFAGFLALIMAYAGLNTWARQLHGTGEYEVARRILKCLITIRESVWYVRARGIREGEIRRAVERVQAEGRADDRRRVNEIVHENRWQLVQQPWAELETTLIEAEVLWGQEFSDQFDELRQNLQNLSLNVGYYLSGITSPCEREAYSPDHWEHIASVALGSGTREDPDDFQRCLNTVLDHLDSLVRSRMRNAIGRGPIRDMFKNISEGRF
jgi:hypothetical protein